MLKPKLFTIAGTFTKEQIISDVMAGIIVAVIALPLAIAFGIASGVTPEQGLITAIMGGFIVSFLGGSRVQIGGPTGAFIVVVYGVVQQFGVQGLLVATLMAGIILVIMGVARLGAIIKFIPHPLTVGFTTGIAVIIFSSQINALLGLGLQKVPADFIEKWMLYFSNFGRINYYALAISGVALLIMVIWPKRWNKIPGSLVAIIVTTAAVQLMHLPVETIGSVFGEIKAQIPVPSVPLVDFATLKKLIIPATTIAMLAAIEALLSAVVADGMIGKRHRSNIELVAQGVANIVSPLFGGIPVTGAIARTAANVKNGGRTPVAGMVHAVVLLFIMLFIGKWAALIPMASLAAVLVIVSYNMSEWRSFIGLFKSPRSDVAVLLTTFLLTVIIDLTVAIEVGLVLAVILFMHRMAMVTNVEVVTREFSEGDEQDDPMAIDRKVLPPGVEVFEINGPFFFGAASKFTDAMYELQNPPKVRILRMRNVPAIDATGIHALEQLYHTSKSTGTHFILSGVHTQPLMALTQNGFLDVVGEENIFGNIDEALLRAQAIVDSIKEKETAKEHLKRTQA